MNFPLVNFQQTNSPNPQLVLGLNMVIFYCVEFPFWTIKVQQTISNAILNDFWINLMYNESKCEEFEQRG